MKIHYILIACALILGGCNKKESITPELSSFEKPKDATVRLEGQAFPYCLWYDPEEWLIINTPFDGNSEASEWTLVLVDLEEEVSLGKNLEKKAIAKTYTYEDKNVSQATYKEFVQKKVLGQNDQSLVSFKDIRSEERLVNGLKLFAWQFEFEHEGLDPIMTYLYFYSDNEGSVSVTTFTEKSDWKENEEKMEELLNGFCLLQS